MKRIIRKNKRISFKQIRKIGLTKSESNKILEAKEISDSLVPTEQSAIKAVESNDKSKAQSIILVVTI